MLIYPIGDLYQRGEDRCQLNISKSSANAMRACNDLGYASAILKKKGYFTFLKDYQSEKLTLEDMYLDIDSFKPNIIFISTTNATIFSDLEIVNQIKKKYPNVVIIFKAALFFNCTKELFYNIDFSNIDYMIGGEEEFIIGDLIDAHFNNKENLKNIEGIIYKINNEYIINKITNFNEDLDSLPFPDRTLMNNKLYVMPDTEESMATIATSRGCPSSCIYCLSPLISGKKVRFRSPQNILEEMLDCYNNHKIRNFFFKSDTFTINKNWTIDICKKIIESNLYGKIRWVANSRVDTIDEEMLSYMKKAGCTLIAFGLESGSNNSLKLMKKNTTIEENYKAIKLAKKEGLQTLGFYIIGFPWETKEDLNKTKEIMIKNNTDFVEVHIATPFTGTELFEMININKDIQNQIYGKNHFDCIHKYSENLDSNYVENFRKKIVLDYYLRPNYIASKILNNIKSPKTIANYIKYGLKLIKNTLLG